MTALFSLPNGKRTPQWKLLAIHRPQMSSRYKTIHSHKEESNIFISDLVGNICVSSFCSPPLTLLSQCSRPWSSALVLIQVESPFRAQCPYNLKMWSFPRHPLCSRAWSHLAPYKSKRFLPQLPSQCQEILQSPLWHQKSLSNFSETLRTTCLLRVPVIAEGL